MHSFSHFQTRLHLSFYKFFKATEWLPWSSIWNLRVHPCLSHGALWRAAEQAAVEEAGSVGEGGWWGSSAKSTHAVLLWRQTPLLCGRSPLDPRRRSSRMGLPNLRHRFLPRRCRRGPLLCGCLSRFPHPGAICLEQLTSRRRRILLWPQHLAVNN